ncbi:MAG: glutathione S-transferase N-terminal domain-containing protein [Fluviicoccus sp.]|uniref:glutathione S-transferase N-terminal domain-containing protein n=1 Tax=Fluviicoccus sp. TaxID=2003552 RepID=UPI00271BD272|nr:glutathione S-transferase N-terminal domain-containing protein [Fluviicoccus sp.]MDO8329216.1 glutathione S-transferase N-terminal domain-containing protein [Fluviicoccus sp.]
MKNHLLNIVSSVVSSTLRGWHGSAGSKQVVQPSQRPILFDREDDAECRLVREALTELNLDVMIYPCPLSGNRFKSKLNELSGGQGSVPYLMDPNSGERHGGAQAIVEYLFRQYRQKPAPRHLNINEWNLLTSRLAGTVRGRRILAQPSVTPELPLTLYSFESSPYSRPVREKLCELELPYTLINLGKQQLADVGPAKQRLHFGEYKPLPDTKRSHMLAEKGRVQVPFLIDPNHGVEMFESKDILAYLERTYQFPG